MAKKLMQKVPLALVLIILFTLTVSAAVTPGYSDYDASPAVKIDVTEKIAEIVSEKTGIAVNIPTKALPKGTTEVSFESRELKGDNKTKVFTAAKPEGSPVSVISMKLFDQKEKEITNLTNEVTLTVPVTGGANAVGYYDEETDEVVMLESKLVNKGFIEFQTDKLGIFVLIKVKTKK